nr:hypothetical protein [Tanacetum cinerariifolium]
MIQITVGQEYTRLLGNLAWPHFQMERYKTIEELYRYLCDLSLLPPIMGAEKGLSKQVQWATCVAAESKKNRAGYLSHKAVVEAAVVLIVGLAFVVFSASKNASSANGITKLSGIDVGDTFSPVVKPATIRTVISLVVSRHWHVHQLDEFFMTDLGSLNYFIGMLIMRDSFEMFLSQHVDWASFLTTRRSTSWYCVFLDNNLIYCSYKRQLTLSRTSVEVEYHDVANVVTETC